MTLTEEKPPTWARDRLIVLTKAAALGRLAAQLAREDRVPVVEASMPRARRTPTTARLVIMRDEYRSYSYACKPCGRPCKVGDKSPTGVNSSAGTVWRLGGRPTKCR